MYVYIYIYIYSYMSCETISRPATPGLLTIEPMPAAAWSSALHVLNITSYGSKCFKRTGHRSSWCTYSYLSSQTCWSSTVLLDGRLARQLIGWECMHMMPVYPQYCELIQGTISSFHKISIMTMAIRKHQNFCTWMANVGSFYCGHFRLTSNCSCRCGQFGSF